MVYEDSSLERVIFASESGGEVDVDGGGLVALAMSAGLTTDDASAWRETVRLDIPSTGDDPAGRRAVGVFDDAEGHFIFAYAYQHPDNDGRIQHQYVRFPRASLQALAGNLHSLIEIAQAPSTLPEDGTPLSQLDVSPSPTWTTDRRKMIFERLLAMKRFDMTLIFALLGAALSDEGLMIRGFGADFDSRLDLVQGLLMLLPSSARPLLTFATYQEVPQPAGARIVFSDSADAAGRWVVDFTQDDVNRLAIGLMADDRLCTPYIAALQAIWSGELDDFIAELRALEVIAARVLAEKPDVEHLTDVAMRYQLDVRALAGEDIPIEMVKQILSDDAPADGPLLLRYTSLLLDYVLHERDPEAVGLVTQFMDVDDELNNILTERLRGMVEGEPDAVYFFIRTRMTAGVEESWLPLLRDAAHAAMQVAISDGDSETLISWLRLIGREPADYGLEDVFRDGIRAAQPRAREDGVLAGQLVVFTARRAPDMLEGLLNDDALLAVMDAPLGPVLREYDPEFLAAAIKLNRETALIIMSRAAANAPENPAAAAVFTLENVDYLWSLYRNGQLTHLPGPQQPGSIIAVLTGSGGDWLSPEISKGLLLRIISGEDEARLMEMAASMASRDALLEPLVSAVQAVELPTPDLIRLLTPLMEQEIISRQAMVDVYLQLIESRGWGAPTLPFVEQIARILQQSADLTVSSDALWRMLQMAESVKADLVGRVVTRRILARLEALEEDEAAIVETLVHLNERLQWSVSLRLVVMNWWREFAREQGLPRLQKLERALVGKKSLDEARSVVQTNIALRKVLGRRSLEEFAEAIGTAYTILQALSDSFDPSGRQSLNFDAATVRMELDARKDELAGDERSVLAKDLKELAQLISVLAENRSKATLIRRQEEVERQLFTGDQQPQSAVDTMKWLSGYLNRMQDKPGEDE